MKSAEVILSPDSGGFNGPDQALVKSPRITRKDVPYLNLHRDGSCVVLYRVATEGDPSLESTLSGRDDVRTCRIFEAGSDEYLYLHSERGEPLTSLLTIVDELGLILDYPIPFTGNCAVSVIIGGTEEKLRQTITKIPESVEVTIERFTAYDPTPEGVFSRLTSRQQEAISLAFAEGYYEMPRETTCEKLAESLDCTPSTANTLLRYAEATIIEAHVAETMMTGVATQD